MTTTCTTAKSNPPADIKWTIDGREYVNTTQKQIPAPGGGWITTSNVTFTINKDERSVIVICHALNKRISSTATSTHIVSVICKFIVAFIFFSNLWKSGLSCLAQKLSYVVLLDPIDPPTNLEITGHETDTTYNAGALLSITCTAIAGNPPATLTWYKNDKIVSTFIFVLIFNSSLWLSNTRILFNIIYNVSFLRAQLKN